MNDEYLIDLRKPPVPRESAGQEEAHSISEKDALRQSSPSYFSRTIAIMLVIGLAFSPTVRVYASEGDSLGDTASPSELQSESTQVSNSDTSVEVGGEQIETLETSETPSETESLAIDSTEDIASSDEESADSQEHNVATEETEPDDSTSSEDATDGSEEGAGEESGDTSGTNDENSTVDTEEDSVATEAPLAEDSVDLKPASEEVVLEEETDIEPETASAFVALATNDSQVVFETKDCVSLSDGEYYCVRKDQTAEVSPSPKTATVSAEARKDAEGDLEIYVTDGNGTKQITNNSIDDDSPKYDETAKYLVWHALVDDRYQIFFHDISRSETFQITNESYNNTNADVSLRTIVWQAWADDNWEIFAATYAPGAVEPFVVERVTRTSDPDMFPKIHGRLLTWQSRSGDQWLSLGFNLDTKELLHLGEGTNGDVTSSRLVFLVERRDENGNIVRVGYDIETGETLPLGGAPENTPQPIPENPTQEQTGVIPENTVTAKTPRATDAEDDTDDEGDNEGIVSEPILE